MIINKQNNTSYENHVIYRSYFLTKPTITEIVICEKMMELSNRKCLLKAKSNVILESLIVNGLLNKFESDEQKKSYILAIKRVKKHLKHINSSYINMWGLHLI